MNCSERFSATVIEKIKKAIKEVNGNEILCIGRLDSDTIVTEIVQAARGNRESVPVLLPFVDSGDVIIHNHPSGNLNPSQPDLEIAARLGNQGIGFYIINNDCSEVYCVAEAISGKEIVPLDEEEMAAFFSDNGLLKQHHHQYESRKSQIELCRAICRAFNQNTILSAEAGTGVGKSFSYILPALKWARSNQERVVISTATINLQQQLLEKDIPFINNIIKSGCRYFLVKGRQNYLCLRRLKEAGSEAQLFENYNEELDKIRVWAKTSTDGSRSDLAFKPLPELWSEICSEKESCPGINCEERDKCFFLRSRKEAALANVLIVNHHLLLADLSLRMKTEEANLSLVLPPFKRVILDEAHNIPSTTSSFFTAVCNNMILKKAFFRIFHRKKRKIPGGVLPEMRKEFSLTLPKNIEEDQKKLTEEWDKAESLAAAILLEERFLRLKDNAAIMTDFMGQLDNFLKKLRQYLQKIINFTDSLHEADYMTMSYQKYIKAVHSIEEIMVCCQDFIDQNDDDQHVFFISREYLRNNQTFLQINIAPIEVSGLLNKALFAVYDSVIMTSATLSLHNNFSYWARESGTYLVPQERQICNSFPSPFDYQNRVLMTVPTDAPAPNEEGYRDYTHRYIFAALQISEGKGLVLFTSNYALRDCYDRLKDKLEEKGILCLAQGKQARNKLIESFKSNINSVLFATMSFWEGIDVPGDALRLLIITRLPFSVPDNPVLKAREEKIKANGGNSFFELSVPTAVIRFKQGFGRLMRHRNDFGVITVLDSRLIKKSYGSFFLKAIPESRQSIQRGKATLDALEEHINRFSKK